MPAFPMLTKSCCNGFLCSPIKGAAMQDHQSVAQHYTHGGLLDAILKGVIALGKTSAAVNIDDIAPVDEFHIGGRKASVEFFDQLHFSSTHHVLDVGCGLG